MIVDLEQWSFCVRILESDNVRGMTIFRYTCSIHYVVRVEENFEVRSSGISFWYNLHFVIRKRIMRKDYCQSKNIELEEF